MDRIERKLNSPFKKGIFRLTSGPNGTRITLKNYWERKDATVYKIRISSGYSVNTFKELVDEVARITLENRNYEMFYRGQSFDYKDNQSIYYKNKTQKTIIYPTICRPNKNEDGKYKASIRKKKIIERYENLRKMIDLIRLEDKSNYYIDEYYISLFQHYNILPTPLIDITQSLRVAATFALRKSEKGYLYVFGLPYPNGSISHYIDQGIAIIKLQNVSPVIALKPRYQEGFLVGKYPIRPTKEEGDNLARRLVAKFYLDNSKGVFWDKDFLPMPEEVLFPVKDEFEKQLNYFKEIFIRKYNINDNN
jgi:hypothetical protein